MVIQTWGSQRHCSKMEGAEPTTSRRQLTRLVANDQIRAFKQKLEFCKICICGVDRRGVLPHRSHCTWRHGAGASLTDYGEASEYETHGSHVGHRLCEMVTVFQCQRDAPIVCQKIPGPSQVPAISAVPGIEEGSQLHQMTLLSDNWSLSCVCQLAPSLCHTDLCHEGQKPIWGLGAGIFFLPWFRAALPNRNILQATQVISNFLVATLQSEKTQVIRLF